MVGDPAEIDVVELEFDDANEDHLARHGVSRGDIESVNANAPRFFNNLPDRAASHVMIGPDDDGQFFYIALAQTPIEGRWRPVTGWPLGRRALGFYEKGTA